VVKLQIMSDLPCNLSLTSEDSGGSSACVRTAQADHGFTNAPNTSLVKSTAQQGHDVPFPSPWHHVRLQGQVETTERVN